ncbi:MAG: renalase [Myxococcota bacterium]|jgi:renalase
MTAQVAIIGAGMAGLACAQALTAAGRAVQIFEKSRGPGGRMSTRRSGPRRYDHGAQYFTARDPGFGRVVARWEAEGLVAAWEGRLATLRRGQLTPHIAKHPRYVGVPRMSALTRHLCMDLPLHTGVRVARVAEVAGGGLELRDEHDAALGRFDQVVVATPAAQAVPLLEAAPALAAAAEAGVMEPCLAAMVTVAAPIALPVDGAWVEDSPLAWIARGASRPGRPEADSWVLQASHAWSRQHLEDALDDIAQALWEALGEAAGASPGERTEAMGHRWRHAIPRGPYPDGPLLDRTVGLGACGDWCVGPRVEAAWLSGQGLARAIISGT